MPRRRSAWRAALIGALFFAGACNFTIAGVDAPGNGGGGGGGSPPGMTAAPDLAMPTTPADLAIAHDLATPKPMPDLTPLPDKIGDACAGSCGAALTCMNWVPNGYCSESCESSDVKCPPGSTCVDTSGGKGGGSSATHYCLANAPGDNCMRTDLTCRDCGAKVCGPSSFCDGC